MMTSTERDEGFSPQIESPKVNTFAQSPSKKSSNGNNHVHFWNFESNHNSQEEELFRRDNKRKPNNLNEIKDKKEISDLSNVSKESIAPMEKAKTQTEKSRDIRSSVDKENVKIKSPTQRTYSTPSNTNSYISSPLSTPPLSTTDYLTTRLVHLIWPYEGFDVKICGTFNGWNPIPMKRDEFGVFSIHLPLLPGTHQFKFIVDGRWCYDSSKPSTTDQFGNNNTIAKYI